MIVLSPAPTPGAPTPPNPGDPRWAAVLARDPRADGQFVYAVRTTGIYCRPSCPSRRARPRNVAFYATPAEATAAGFRPCRRCTPDRARKPSATAAAIAAACRRIDESDAAPPLATLAREAGFSPAHFHRAFKRATGLTPRAYAAARARARVQAGLAAGETVTAAIYDAGYSSSSRFYERDAAMFAMTPTAFRKGGAGEEIRFAAGRSSLGAVLVAATARGVCAVLLGADQAALQRDLAARFSRARLVPGDDTFRAVVKRAIDLVEHPERGFDLPLDVRGTAFQERVWRALRELPPGTTTTYGAIAARLGKPDAVRAVASACAANPVAIAIPCHRVVRGDGALAGYRWGVARKRALLAREAGAKTRKAGTQKPSSQPGST
jgi:AraC family transcriptional regulator of adaptative response/methylated-DNA-[protein]-cysteine methyltransferase